MTKKVRVHGFEMYEDDVSLLDEAIDSLPRKLSRSEFFRESAIERARKVIASARRRDKALHCKIKRQAE